MKSGLRLNPLYQMKIKIDFEKYINQQRLIGEMAGCLSIVVILCSDKQINKEGVKDLLIRYEKEFNETHITVCEEEK